MKNRYVAALALGTVGVITLAVLWPWKRGIWSLLTKAVLRPVPVQHEPSEWTGNGPGLGRAPVQPREESAAVALPPGHGALDNEQELAEFVAWMRSLDHDELLRLSNAEFGFKKSELVDRLRQLSGPWVVSALGDLAMAEGDPLLKAILVAGLVDGIHIERLDDVHLLPILDSLMTDLRSAAADPFDVAKGLAMTAYMACLGKGQDYVLLMSKHLALSDDRGFLVHGYLFMGHAPGEGAAEILKQALLAHPSPEGRMGALEGLRGEATDGKLPPAELTALGLAALEGETSERNRLLLYEMMIAAGGDEGVDAVEGIVREGKTTEIAQTVEMLAMKMEPARALALFQDVLRDQELDGASKQALYNAMGLVPGDEGRDFLLGLVHDDGLSEEERLAGLRGLWNRPVDEELAGELKAVFDNGGSASLRTEALRMLASGETQGAGLDLREIGALDDDPAVRAEAVQLAALQPSDDSRAWLEQRLFEDDSFDVKAAALGALVVQAHYTGDGDTVLGYLARAREFTSDESALAMIAEGERMVKDYDPRRVDLELAEDAKLWSTVARYTSGPAARSFERRARQLEQVVTALRAAKR